MIAVVSSVAVFIMASILFFIIGFLCGHFRICQKRRKRSAATAGETQSVPSGVAVGGHSQIPYYDDVVLHATGSRTERKCSLWSIEIISVTVYTVVCNH